MKELTKKEVADVQITTLKSVDDFCRKNNIQYCLAYGSLLGAVRHGGYIPWDDDIDIAMPRESYNKFISTFHAPQIALLECHHDPTYPFPFAKVCDKRTLLVEESSVTVENHGIDIDIFPIDNLPKNRLGIHYRYFIVGLLRNILDIKSIPLRKRRNILKNITLWIGKKTFLFISANQISVMINKLSIGKDNGPYMGIIVWGYGIKQVVRKEIFDEYRDMKFENIISLAPIRYSEWLHATYGDYMKLPPLDQRITHHRRKVYRLEE